MNETLRELRIKNRYSQELLAKVLGISRQAYIKYESGEVEPSINVIRKLCKIYKVSYEVILGKLDLYENNYQINDNNFYMCASPAMTYSAKPNTEQDLQQIIVLMQETIKSMQNLLQKNQISTYSKSRSFNKSDFFSKIGNVNIDSADIIQNREDSLI